MNWFLVYFFVMGIVLGIVPRVVMKNIKKAIETNFIERDKAFEKINGGLFFYAWVIILTSLGFTLQLTVETDKAMKKIDSRIERIEKQTPTPAVDTLYLYKNLADCDGPLPKKEE